MFQKYCSEARGHSGTRPGKMAEANPVSMMHTNGSFVISLLKECKAKVRGHKYYNSNNALVFGTAVVCFGRMCNSNRI